MMYCSPDKNNHPSERQMKDYAKEFNLPLNCIQVCFIIIIRPQEN